MRIGIDLMGSDRSPELLFDAVLEVVKQSDPAWTFIIFATSDICEQLQKWHQAVLQATAMARLAFIVTDDVITMRDDPVTAVRRKKNSSIVQGIRAIKRKQIDAFVSAGNTGALVTAATLHLPLLSGVRRPALLAMLPTEKEDIAVLDVGGNVQGKAIHLIRYAELGTSFIKILNNISTPKVGLLNVGVESKKGTLEHRHAYEKLEQIAQSTQKFHFLGNVEGREIFQGKVDVLVTDGFTGNILLKATEGLAVFLLEFLKKTISSTHSTQTHHLLQNLQSQFSYTEYPGAILVGVDGVIVKCHGDASSKALVNGIKAAMGYVEQKLIEQVKKEFSAYPL